MSLRELIAAIPKVELNLQLTGSLVESSLLMIARQNGVPGEMDDFRSWVDQLSTPDYDSLDELAAVAGSWVRYKEDLTRVVYDIGVALSKQNVCYAEICVAPSDFVRSPGMGIESVISALEDGRDRVRRAWGVEISWIFCIPRNNPRTGDDVARWASSAAAKNGNVVAIGLIGKEDAQPVGQFKRAFSMARKKDVHTIADAGSRLGLPGISPALEELEPERLTESWGLHEDEQLLQSLADTGTPLVVSISRAVCLGLVPNASAYPLRKLLDNNIQVVLSSGMPHLYKTTLIDEYMLAYSECGLSAEEILAMARRSFELCFQDEERKQSLLDLFDKGVDTARAI